MILHLSPKDIYHYVKQKEFKILYFYKDNDDKSRKLNRRMIKISKYFVFLKCLKVNWIEMLNSYKNFKEIHFCNDVISLGDGIIINSIRNPDLSYLCMIFLRASNANKNKYFRKLYAKTLCTGRKYNFLTKKLKDLQSDTSLESIGLNINNLNVKDFSKQRNEEENPIPKESEISDESIITKNIKDKNKFQSNFDRLTKIKNTSDYFHENERFFDFSNYRYYEPKNVSSYTKTGKYKILPKYQKEKYKFYSKNEILQNLEKTDPLLSKKSFQNSKKCSDAGSSPLFLNDRIFNNDINLASSITNDVRNDQTNLRKAKLIGCESVKKYYMSDINERKLYLFNKNRNQNDKSVFVQCKDAFGESASIKLKDISKKNNSNKYYEDDEDEDLFFY